MSAKDDDDRLIARIKGVSPVEDADPNDPTNPNVLHPMTIIPEVTVTAADYNGRTWDSSPFTPVPAPLGL